MVGVVIANWERAHEILSASDRSGVTHVVSIGEPRSAQPPAVARTRLPKLRLEFDDISFVSKEAERENDLDGHYTLPTRQDIEKLIDFLKPIKRGKVLFHCAAGISRSAASACIFHAIQLGPGREREAIALTRMVKNTIHPNKRMLAHADKLLDRNGRLLLAACDVWPERYIPVV